MNRLKLIVLGAATSIATSIIGVTLFKLPPLSPNEILLLAFVCAWCADGCRAVLAQKDGGSNG